MTRADLDSVLARVESLEVNYRQLVNDRVRPMENRFDTADSPWWKRTLFRIQGWPPWFRLAARPKWRPWQRNRWPWA